jgi:hypothetical protein
MQSELQELELIIPCSKIDLNLLSKMQNELIGIRGRITTSRSKDYETLSGLLHLCDYLIDVYLDAIGNLVLIQDYAVHRQYFVASGMYCRSHADSEVYEQVLRSKKIVSESSVIGCPSKRFSGNDWTNFKKYGLNEPFELK